MDDERLIELLGLKSLLAPAPGRGTEVPVDVKGGLDAIGDEIDRATREWIAGAAAPAGRPEGSDD